MELFLIALVVVVFLMDLYLLNRRDRVEAKHDEGQRRNRAGDDGDYD
jgi:hypothetical protein